jgi:alcohol dehydrogenase class IV
MPRGNAQVAQKELAALAGRLFPHSPTESPAEAVQLLIERIEQLCRLVKVPQRLSEVGVTRQQLPDVVRGSRGSSMSGNPRMLSDAELLDVLEGVL